MKLFVYLALTQLSQVDGIHNDGGGCYDYQEKWSLIQNTGIQETIIPIKPKSATSNCA